MHKKAFTLVEILIVVVLFGMLAGIILQTYTTISQVSFRIHQEKEIAKEALLLSQVLESLSQTMTIDYSKYEREELQKNKGIVDVLYLKDDTTKTIKIFSTSSSAPSACLSQKELDERDSTNSPKNSSYTEGGSEEHSCQLQMEIREWVDEKEQISQALLLDGQNFKLTQIKFKVVPFIWNEDLKTLYQEDSLREGIPNAWHPAFWLLGTLYSNHYNPKKRSNNIALPLQLFFSLQGKTTNIYSTTNENEAP